jgi:hypothetical protein
MAQSGVGRRVALFWVVLLLALTIATGAAASAGSWAQVFPATSPSVRVNFGMASDGSGEVVLFGGFDNFPVGNLGDTWIWDGADWDQAAPAASPPARSGPAMAGDGRGNVILFGGSGSTGQDGRKRFLGALAARVPSPRANSSLGVRMRLDGRGPASVPPRTRATRGAWIRRTVVIWAIEATRWRASPCVNSW